MSLVLKFLNYPGFAGGEGAIVYTIDGRNVYFSGLTLPHVATSTINGAERIIALLAAAEGIVPRLVTFFDIQTNRGYATKQPGTFEIEQLRLQCVGDSISVEQWTPVAMSDDLIAQSYRGTQSRDQLAGVPQAVMDIFRPYIDE